MAQLAAQIISEDEEFRRQAERLLRSGPTPVSFIDERLAREGATCDLVIVDLRHDAL